MHFKVFVSVTNVIWHIGYSNPTFLCNCNYLFTFYPHLGAGDYNFSTILSFCKLVLVTWIGVTGLLCNFRISLFITFPTISPPFAVNLFFIQNILLLLGVLQVFMLSVRYLERGYWVALKLYKNLILHHAGESHSFECYISSVKRELI